MYLCIYSFVGLVIFTIYRQKGKDESTTVVALSFRKGSTDREKVQLN